MSIVMTVSLYDFRQAFVTANRHENFSYEGLELIFDHLEALSDDISESIDLDVIAICCEYSECTIAEYIEDYSMDVTNLVDYVLLLDAIKGCMIKDDSVPYFIRDLINGISSAYEDIIIDLANHYGLSIVDYCEEDDLQSAIQDDCYGYIIGFTDNGTVVYQQH